MTSSRWNGNWGRRVWLKVTTGLVLGWLVTFLGHPRLVRAQTFSDREVTSYARAVLAIETIRRVALREVRNLLKRQDLPAILCTQVDRIQQLSPPVRRVVLGYCRQSKTLVEGNGLSAREFNRITLTQERDPHLRQRIQAVLLRLMAKSPP